MKNEKSKVAFLKIIGATVLLVAILTICIVAPLISKNKNVYTVYSDDEYYSETTYYLSEAAYKKELQKSEAKSKSKKQVAGQLAETDEQIEGDFVIAVKKRVFVRETTNESGVVEDSRLMSKSEVEKIDKELSSVTNQSAEVLTTGATAYLGDDKESFYYLDIYMQNYVTADGIYHIYGKASWAEKLVAFWDNDEAAEEFYFDYIGITWGGMNLNEEKPTITGKYYSGKDVNFTKVNSNSYAGYVWRFNEKEGWLGKEMESAQIWVDLQNQGQVQGNYTCAQLTYIHTYGEIDTTVTLEINSNLELAASVSIEESEKSWQIEISVGGILY